jgi:N-acylneuraminate cytidylyltransferase
MKNIAVIPARGGSKRLPDKNILPLAGIPLLAHSILYAQANTDTIDAVYVSTNDDRIKSIALGYGAQVIDRPEALSGDLEPTASAIKHCLESIGQNVENVFLLQPTNPLRPGQLLSQAYQAYCDNACDSLLTVSRSYGKFGKIESNKFVPFTYEPGQRSQDLGPLYFENGLLYISKAELILGAKIISADAFPFVVDHVFATVDIDTQEDFDYAAYVLGNIKS